MNFDKVYFKDLINTDDFSTNLIRIFYFIFYEQFFIN